MIKIVSLLFVLFILGGCSLGSLSLSSTDGSVIVHQDSTGLGWYLNQNDYRNSIYLYNKVKEDHGTSH